MSQGQFSRSIFAVANAIVEFGRELPKLVLSASYTMKPDGSYVSGIDLTLELRIEKLIKRFFPNTPVVGEELNRWIPEGGSPFFLVDPLDGTSYLLRGMRDHCSISVGLVHNGRPNAGIIVQPWVEAAFVSIRGHGVWYRGRGDAEWVRLRPAESYMCQLGTDISPFDAAELKVSPSYLKQREKLIRAEIFGTETRNYPAVGAGIEVALGMCSMWWTETAHAWDLPAAVVIIKELGGAAECLDGTPLLFNDSLNDSNGKLPPVILASSPTLARIARLSLNYGEPIE